jgi:ABC-type transporter Mla subunit MlaD
MQRLTQRADGLLAREEPALVQTLDHLRVITQQLAELATKLNADPAQLLFSVPPAPLTAP